ncbi:hypothetical protein L3X38_035008 [Prunus dulcis]|uniref:Uncharacterized protein n=1 Tax=Prunus dulcis TaxID=3755 RepID=A0AAD4VIW3_PRUDU|nr:hypothetical protein L3X38_035008 [Prunus dulcis]
MGGQISQVHQGYHHAWLAHGQGKITPLCGRPLASSPQDKISLLTYSTIWFMNIAMNNSCPGHFEDAPIWQLPNIPIHRQHHFAGLRGPTTISIQWEAYVFGTLYQQFLIKHWGQPKIARRTHKHIPPIEPHLAEALRTWSPCRMNHHLALPCIDLCYSPRLQKPLTARVVTPCKYIPKLYSSKIMPLPLPKPTMPKCPKLETNLL